MIMCSMFYSFITVVIEIIIDEFRANKIMLKLPGFHSLLVLKVKKKLYN